jgi:hypothetical protein
VAESEVYIPGSSWGQGGAVSGTHYCSAAKSAVDIPLGYCSTLWDVSAVYVRIKIIITFVRSIISMVSPMRRNCLKLVDFRSWLQRMEYVDDKSKELSLSSSSNDPRTSGNFQLKTLQIVNRVKPLQLTIMYLAASTLSRREVPITSFTSIDFNKSSFSC